MYVDVAEAMASLPLRLRGKDTFVREKFTMRARSIDHDNGPKTNKQACLISRWGCRRTRGWCFEVAKPTPTSLRASADLRRVQPCDALETIQAGSAYIISMSSRK